MLTSILFSLLAISVLILVHELGHFIAAKRSGVFVEEFGIGLPPRIFGKKIKGTIYSINLLPFGGFVRLHGENSQEDIKYPEKAFLNKGKLTRVKIIIAGVLMNFILGILAFAVSYSFSGIPKETKKVKVLEVSVGSPAQVAGILVGDVVKSVNKKEVKKTSDFISIVSENADKKIQLLIERNLGGAPEDVKISLTPRSNPPEGEGPLGVIISSSEIYYPPIYKRPFLGIYYGVYEALYWGKTIVVGLFDMVKGLFLGDLPSDISGPVGIFAITTQAAKYGVFSLINFLGIFSINLAILNILPFPALDGGRLFFIGLEAVLGRKILPKIESAIHMIGMAILILLLVAVTIKDIQRVVSAGGFSKFLETVVK